VQDWSQALLAFNPQYALDVLTSRRAQVFGDDVAVFDDQRVI
jgi:hypothetical protein